jgi:hypothetical protein
MAGIHGSFSSDTTRAIMPAMPPAAYKTYGMSMPLKTHWRRATCEEFGCVAYQSGWVTTVDTSTELGRKQYAYCKADRERSFSVQRPEPMLFKFVYAPGNRCFLEHQLPLGRPVRFYVAEGDWRGNPRRIPARVHQYAEDWVEDFSIHQGALKTAIEKG